MPPKIHPFRGRRKIPGEVIDDALLRGYHSDDHDKANQNLKKNQILYIV